MRRLFCLLLLALPALSWPQTRKFQNPTLLPTANDPGALAVGDWNGDNKRDLIYIDGSVVGALHVLLGNGDGTFTPGQTIALPADACRYYTGRSCYLSSADINGDGKADLIFAGVGNSLPTTYAIFTLPGNGDGTFGAPIVSNISSLASSAFVTFKPGIADFNGDRKVDLVVADPLNGGLYFLAGDGAGHFAYSSRFNNTKYNTGRPSLVYAGDYNADGKLDVLVLSSGGTTTAVVYFGDGSGGFVEGPGYSAGLSSTNYASFTLYKDVNGDGIADLVGTDAQSNVWILPGRSDGSFGSALQLPTQLEAKDSILSAADINGDGLMDYVALTSAGLRILPGAAGTTLGAAQVVTAGAANVFGTVTADFNGDGIQDIASATEGGIVLLFGRTTGGLGSTTLIDTGKPAVNAIVGDFNGDGTDDALVQQSDGIQTFFGSASGGLSAGPSTPGVSMTYIGNAVGDFDGDGKLDAVSGNGGIQILYGSGDGRFSPGAVTAGLSYGIVSELNGDGKSDFVGITGPTMDIASNYIYTLTSLMGSSSRTPTKVTTILPPLRQGNLSPLLAAVGDLNHDGHADAAFYEQNQQVLEIWVGNGDGTFRAADTVDTAAMQIKLGATTASNGFAGIGDFDGDGNADVVALGYQANAFTSISSWCIVVFYGDGSGGVSSTQILPTTHPYNSLYLSDVNHDGNVDVVMTDGVLISAMINGGNKVFGGEQHYVAGASFKTLSPGDFNGDHYPDLLAVNSSSLGPFGSNILTLLLNQPDPRHAVSGAIVASPATVAYNANFTLTASLSPTSSGGPAPSGTVQFSVDGVQIGAGSVQNGVATISVPGQTTQSIFYGLHTVAGVYSGDGYYPGAWISGALTVLKPDYPTSTVLTASPTTTLASDYVTLNATVTAPAVVTSGVVTFYDGAPVLGQSKVSLTGSATLQTNLLSVGSHTLKAVYQGFFPVISQVGNAIFEPSTSSAVAVTITAIPTAITVSTSNSPSVVGTVVAVRAVVTSSASTPNGSVTFFDGSKSLGTISLNNTGTAIFNTSSLATGLHALSAVYNANGIFASSRAATTSITVTAAASTLHSSYVLFTGVATDRSASATIMTAMVGSLSGNPSGAVTLIEDGEIIGTGRIASSGLVTFHVDHIDSAAHAFYASYAGTDQYAPSSSRVALSTTYPGGPEFSLQWASSSPILALNSRSGDPSRTNVIQLQLNVDNGWSGAVSLSCPDSASEGYWCDFSPATMAGAGSSSLTIRPMTTVNYLHSYSVTMFALVFAVPCVCYRKRRMVVLACISLITLLGCGLGKTPADTGTRVITVQAASGNIVHSIQVLAKASSAGQ